MDDLRKEIGGIDKALLQLIRDRLDVAKKIGVYKKENNLPVIHPAQEQAVYERIEKEAKSKNLNKEEINRIWKSLIKMSREEQEK